MKLTFPILVRDLYVALADASRHKHKMSYVRKFHSNLKINILRLALALILRKYKPLPSKCFIVDRPKKREVFAAQFSRQNRTSSVLQLYAQTLRGDIYQGFIFLYQRTRYARRRYTFGRPYPQGKQELDKKMLCTEIGYTRLFYAHRPQKAVTDMPAESRKNVYSQNAKGFMSRKRRDMGTSDRHGLCTLVNGNYCDARPKNIVRTGDAAVGMGRSRLRQVPVLHQGRLRTAYWKSYLTIILQRISQRARSVYEASTALSSLWSVCRRFLCRELRQKMVTLVGAAYTPISTKRTASRPAHGKDTCLRGASRSRVSRSLYQTISHISIIGYAAPHSKKYQRDGFWQPTTGLAFRQLLSWNPFPYSIVQSVSQVVLPKGVSSYCTI